MSGGRKRLRRDRSPRPVGASPATGTPAATAPPLAEWRWRTFPVFFAFALALFVGIYLGFVAGYIQGDSGSSRPALVLFVFSALLLGFALSRMTTRFFIARRWVKPRARARR